MTLTEFLLARIAEDEAAATAATAGPWTVAERRDKSICGIDQRDGYDDVVSPGDVSCMAYCYGGTSTIEARDEDWRHIARHDPARVLAECEAKRRILARHTNCDDTSFGEPCDDLRALAHPYADHPDYQDEWKP